MSAWTLPTSDISKAAVDLKEIIEAEKYEKRSAKQKEKQIQKDFEYAKLLVTYDSSLPEIKQTTSTAQVLKTSSESSSSYDGPCCSSNANYLINSIDLPNDNQSESTMNNEMDDQKIAELLQAEFDLEYDEELKRIEKAKNKNSKVSVSYQKYRIYPDELLQHDSDKEDEDTIDQMRRKNWDRFEKNDKEISKIGKSGYYEDEEGEIRTKHDMIMSGRKNAGKVMDFHCDFSSGDCGNFDMKISNKVFNELRKYSFSMAKKNNQMQDRREDEKTSEMGMDQKTRLLLYKFINNMIIDNIDGIVSKGKEAVVLHGEGNTHHEEMKIPKEVAIKIFSTTLNEFKQRDRYIKDDFRFKGKGQLKQNNKYIIHMWCEKEFYNLNRLKKAQIPCPIAITFKKHILIMSYIGNGHENPAPKLKDVKLSVADMICAYEEVVDIMKRMYQDAKLIHADFSEYNILYYEGKLYVIDLAQAVEPYHPSAFEFLMRDCYNITSFFEKHQVPVKTKEELFFEITKLDPLTTDMNMLEKVHMKGDPAHIVTTPRNLDDFERERVPEKYRLKEFPFDYAWKKVEEMKLKGIDENSKIEEKEEESWTEVVTKKKSKEKNSTNIIIDNTTTKICDEISVKNC